MKSCCYLVLWSVFVEAGILPHNIFILILSKGERGVPKHLTVSLTEMAEIRRKEFDTAVGSLGFSHSILDFPDTEIEDNIQEVRTIILGFIRRLSIDLVLSFHPEEYTPHVDHPDHNAAGKATRYAASYADIGNLLPEIQALEKRPELFFWTTALHLATHYVGFNAEVFNKWMKYLEYYQSQFSGSDHENVVEEVFVPIFTAREWEFDDIEEWKNLPFRVFLTKIR